MLVFIPFHDLIKGTTTSNNWQRQRDELEFEDD